MKRNSLRVAVALTTALTTAAAPLLVGAQTAYEYKAYKQGLVVTGAASSPGTPSPGPVTPAPQPALQLSTTAINFGDVATNTTETRQVLVSNTGTGSLSLTAAPMVTGDVAFAAGLTTCGATLAAGADCLTDATFSPTTVGAYNGVLKFTSVLANSPHEVTLVGTAFNPVSLASTTLPKGMSGAGYSTNLISGLTIAGAYDPAMVSWDIVAGALPEGVSLSKSGVLSGTPDLPGLYSFEARATYQGNSGRAAYLLEVTVATDPYLENVSLLLNFDGTPGAKTWSEPVKGATLTLSGAAQLSAERKFGSSSLSVIGGFATMQGTRFAVGTRPFTLEMFVQRNPTTQGQLLALDCRPLNSDGPYIALTVLEGGGVSLYVNGATHVSSPAGTIPTDGQWYHLAYSRDSSGVGRLFVNGVQMGTRVDTVSYSAPATVGIGRHAWGVATAGGYVDGLRLTDGVGRYTSNFAAPSRPYPVQ